MPMLWLNLVFTLQDLNHAPVLVIVDGLGHRKGESLLGPALALRLHLKYWNVFRHTGHICEAPKPVISFVLKGR